MTETTNPRPAATLVMHRIGTLLDRIVEAEGVERELRGTPIPRQGERSGPIRRLSIERRPDPAA